MTSQPPVTFFVIGAAKCGTTSLYRALETHPDVYCPSVKEPRFFAENSGKGWDWYASLYAGAEACGAAGDFSPNYSNATTRNEIAKSIAAHYPGARILYMVRNPIACAISNWRMYAETAKPPKSFEEAFTGSQAGIILHRAMFFKQLSEYLRFFDRSQMLCIPIETFRQDPDGSMKRVHDHIGVEHIPVSAFPRANTADRKPNRPPAPETSLRVRKQFIAKIRDDASAMLDYLDLPETFWDISVTAKGWGGLG